MSTMSYMSTYMSHICQQSIRKVERKNVSFSYLFAFKQITLVVEPYPKKL